MCPLVSKNSLNAARVRAPVHEGRKSSPRDKRGELSGLTHAGPEGAGTKRLEGGVKVCFWKEHYQPHIRSIEI